MSADNEIAILQTADGWRVAHCRSSHVWALHPVMENPTSDQRRILREAFGNEPRWDTKSDAYEHAKTWYEELEVVEYGITSYRVPLRWEEL